MNRWFLLAFVCFFSGVGSGSVAYAEESDDEDIGSDTDVSAESSLGIGGWVEFRPSYAGDGSGLHAENEAALQYGITESAFLGYTQEFRFEYLGEGYAWGDFSDLVKAGPFALGYEPRIYFPTSAIEKKTGFNFATRHYLKLSWELNRNAALFLWEVPILSSYKEAGYEIGEDDEEEEELVANPWFENRVELGARLSFFDDRLRLRLPLILQSLRHSNFDDEALNNNRWTHLMWVYPEVTFQVAGTTSLGVGYYSDTIADDSLKTFSIGAGLGHGVFQMVFQQTL